jgi:hypothetical protein
MTTTYTGIECHKAAKAAAKMAVHVFNAKVEEEIIASGTWTVHAFPTDIDEPCRLGNRGVYVEAPGKLTEQFLSPTDSSAVSLTLVLSGVEPVYEERSGVSGSMSIELDPDNPDGDDDPETEEG